MVPSGALHGDLPRPRSVPPPVPVHSQAGRWLGWVGRTRADRVQGPLLTARPGPCREPPWPAAPSPATPCTSTCCSSSCPTRSPSTRYCPPRAGQGQGLLVGPDSPLPVPSGRQYLLGWVAECPCCHHPLPPRHAEGPIRLPPVPGVSAQPSQSLRGSVLHPLPPTSWQWSLTLKRLLFGAQLCILRVSCRLLSI